MRVSVLFSGGKDSSLSALLMEPFFEIELVTCSFGLLPNGELEAQTAKEPPSPRRSATTPL
jgi:predicted subunit of tRNA(5-methylaminomethyl-2-thiouridylate) methyltransferase